ncbi:DUF1295 domain-containing protein [Thalassoglobus sp. JC818]|uniref:DUF1295 domain-containing protein n=1 Tax=Thalassoglobus sp. JC818 TaxID=3232136 RepID=UPI0034587705
MLGETLVWNAAAIGILMLATWIVSIPLRNVSIVDFVWGMGFVIVGWITYGLSVSTYSTTQLLLPCLTTIWGVRLTLYLVWRNSGQPEDKRYVSMRNSRGESFWWQSLFTVFLLQGVVMWVVSLPLQAGIANHQAGWTLLTIAGLMLWGIGLSFESIGDWQLARFRSNPENEGKVLQSGLWKYTRHPNYFGDFCVWWGIYLIAIAHGENYWTAIGPIVMSIFLMQISGVRLLEKSLSQDKPEYAEYARRTNAFFPGPQRT